MVETWFTVGGSRFMALYPGIVRKGERVVWDGVEFVVPEDGVVHFLNPMRKTFDEPRTIVEARLDAPGW